MNSKIPKIIHYCWFGRNEKPPSIKKCMKTWNLLIDYSFMEWNEDNSALTVNRFVQQAYANKKWAYVSDYIRLKALYEYGGIYLDTDVVVHKTFDSLLKHKMFLGFIYDCSIGTAVIGALPNHPIIKGLLDMYEDIIYSDDFSIGFKFTSIKTDEILINNNDLFTYYILNHYPNFQLNNTFQDFSDFVIFPKEYFEIGALFRYYYTNHRCEGSWFSSEENLTPSFRARLKTILYALPLIHFDSLHKHNFYQKILPKLPFYPRYLAQKGKK